MITEVKHTVSVFGIDTTWVEKRSDFKDGEQPKCTGHKRNYRKAKWSKYDFWFERYEVRPRCWKDQSKRRHQYRPVTINE